MWCVTVSYQFNGTWERASKDFDCEIEMGKKIKKYLENEKFTNKCYWINKIALDIVSR